MRGGGNWLAFLAIPLAAVLLLYLIRFLARKFRRKHNVAEGDAVQ